MLRKPSYNNPRGGNEYKKLRRIVLKRDGYRCQMPECGKRYRLQVHHITRHADSVSGRLNPENCICLCFDCHEKVTGHEAHYKTLFFQIVQRNSKK